MRENFNARKKSTRKLWPVVGRSLSRGGVRGLAGFDGFAAHLCRGVYQSQSLALPGDGSPLQEQRFQKILSVLLLRLKDLCYRSLARRGLCSCAPVR
jgi:hypothetical protein